MAEHGIQISVPLIEPLRAGVKTQTRRTVKGAIPREAACGVFAHDAFTRRSKRGEVLSTRAGWEWHDVEGNVVGEPFRCPYGVRGDRLWVREAFRFAAEFDAEPPRAADPANRVWYEADRPHQPGFGKIRPGMFMPRWASRIDLMVLEVRVQRLQDISEDDARDEGIEWNAQLDPAGPSKWRVYGAARSTGTDDPVSSFASLIDSINGDGMWASNPFVFAISFRNLEVES